MMLLLSDGDVAAVGDGNGDADGAVGGNPLRIKCRGNHIAQISGAALRTGAEDDRCGAGAAPK